MSLCLLLSSGNLCCTHKMSLIFEKAAKMFKLSYLNELKKTSRKIEGEKILFQGNLPRGNFLPSKSDKIQKKKKKRNSSLLPDKNFLCLKFCHPPPLPSLRRLKCGIP